VARTAAALRLEHPELDGTPTLEGLLAVCERLGVYVRRPALPAQLLGLAAPPFRGWTIVLVSQALDDEAATAVLLHELGHALLHVQDPRRNARRVRQLDAWPAARRHLAPVVRQEEAEADLFAGLLLGAERYAAVLARVAPDREMNVARGAAR
jgi:Zn-dependent protease with chaperone function